jgi:rubredoxin
MNLEAVKCPYCGYVYRTDAEKVLADGKTTIVRGPKQNSVSKPSQDIYVDLTCPNCSEEFEWLIK